MLSSRALCDVKQQSSALLGSVSPEPFAQVATFEDALRDASAEIDELRAKVSVLQREKGAAALGEFE
jgi:hypothetical protein